MTAEEQVALRQYCAKVLASNRNNMMKAIDNPKYTELQKAVVAAGTQLHSTMHEAFVQAIDAGVVRIYRSQVDLPWRDVGDLHVYRIKDLGANVASGARGSWDALVALSKKAFPQWIQAQAHVDALEEIVASDEVAAFNRLPLDERKRQYQSYTQRRVTLKHLHDAYKRGVITMGEWSRRARAVKGKQLWFKVGPPDYVAR